MKTIFKVLGIALLVMFVISIFGMIFIEEQQPQETEVVKEVKKVEKVEKVEAVKYDEVTKKKIKNEIFTEFKKLYSELNKFKKSEEFTTNGFAGKQREWLKKVRKLGNNPDSKLLLEDRIVVGELSAIAIQYMQSNGKGTESSKFLEKEMRKAIQAYKK